MTPVCHPKRILIIGGGPTGLVSLRNLKERGSFDCVELYERRDDVGGVWNFDDPDILPTTQKRPRWPSPAYAGLIGNVLPEFLSFSEFPFPEPPSTPHQPFPTLKETHQYLQSFAAPYIDSGSIKLNREVVRVEELRDSKGWKVLSRDWNVGGQDVEEIWDAIVIAIGWYDTPVWPQTEGLEELKKRGVAKHSKWWRGPKGYEGKKVLVIGNANSSNDIAAQLAPVAQSPVYQSIRRPALPLFVSLPDDNIEKVAPVVKYIAKSDKFDALLADGTLLSDLDVVQVGTGYKLLPNFIHVINGSAGGTLSPLVTDDLTPHRVPSLHRHILYAHNPSLAFVGAPMLYTPFTVTDVVSTWITFAWMGEIPYPETPEGRLVYERVRLKGVEQLRSSVDDPSSFKSYNVMGPGEQEYARQLKEDVVKARPEFDCILPVWSDERTKLREAMHQTKIDALQYARDHKKKKLICEFRGVHVLIESSS